MPKTGPNNNQMAKRAASAALIGTTIEWYDFYIYATASALVFNQVFFPSMPTGLGLLASFTTFWVGFLGRPIGAICFGHLGDRYGRRKVLVTTLLLTGGATTLIGALPTAAAIGIAAPLLLIALRLIQGFALGGEWGGAVLIATEHAAPNRRVLYGTAAQMGAPLGLCLSLAVFVLLSGLSDSQFASWGWRLPFLSSALLLVVGLVIRLRIDESPDMKEVKESGKTSRLPVADLLRSQAGTVALAIGACAIGATSIVFKTTFALSWATTDLNYDRSTFLSLGVLVAVVSIVAMPAGALVAERYGLVRVIISALVSEAVMLPVMFALIGTGSAPLAAIGMGLATIPNAIFYGILAGLLAQSFPARYRYTGISLSYQLCGALLVGTTPLIAEFLLQQTGTIASVTVFALIQVALSAGCSWVLLKRRPLPSDSGAHDSTRLADASPPTATA